MAGKETGSREGSDARKVKQRGGRRDLDALRDRRMRAAEMFAAGRRPRLDDAQIAVIREELLKGPQAHGFATGVWTLGRVAIVIERLTGVTYGPTQTWTILRTRLGWSRQRPAWRAVERDEDAIVAWRENEWPRIKK
jgi:transposase